MYDAEKRKKQLIKFIEEYGKLCVKYGCAFEFNSCYVMVDFEAIKALPDYREGELEEGMEKQRIGLLKAIDSAVDINDYYPLG